MNKRFIPVLTQSLRRMTYLDRIMASFGSSIVAFYPMNEASGTTMQDVANAYNGAYNGPTLANAPGPAGGELAPTFDGAGDDCDIYPGVSHLTASVAGSIMGWAKIGAAQWVDGATRDVFSIYAASGDNIILKKSSTNNTLSVFFVYGAVNKSFTIPLSCVDWFTYRFAWDKALDKFEFSVNGSPAYVQQTGLGNWTDGYYTDYCRLGGFGGGTEPFIGAQAYVLLLDRFSTAAEHMQFTRLANYLPVMSVIGDSISSGQGWETWANIAARTSGHILKNHAAAGETIIDHLAAQVAAAAGDHAGIIILALGTNDDNAGNMTTLQAEVEENLAVLKVSNPQATIYYMNVLPRWTDTGGGTPVDKSNIRAAIAAACTAQGITCWDPFTTLWIAANQTEDGTHPTFAAGHPAVAAQVLAGLAS